MKRTLKGFIMGLLVATLLMGTVFGSGIQETIEVLFNSVNLSVNGTISGKVGENHILDNGEEVPYSILYKGTTYLPIRKVSEVLNKEVAWDGDTSTVSINDEVDISKDNPQPAPSKPAPSKPTPSNNLPGVSSSLPSGAKHTETITNPGDWSEHSHSYNKSLGGNAKASKVYVTFYSSGNAQVSVSGVDEAGKTFTASAMSSSPTRLSFSAYDASQIAQLSGAQTNEIINVILAFMKSYGL